VIDCDLRWQWITLTDGAHMNTINTGVVSIDHLDLSPMKNILTSSRDDPHSIFRNWSQDFADEIGELYKTFLFLTLKYRHLGRPLVPTREIDEFWHVHMLCSRKYHQDCNEIFGEYIHHDPSDSSDSSDSGLSLQSNFEYTLSLVMKEFPQLGRA
jgi:hypothetical protein